MMILVGILVLLVLLAILVFFVIHRHEQLHEKTDAALAKLDNIANNVNSTSAAVIRAEQSITKAGQAAAQAVAEAAKKAL